MDITEADLTHHKVQPVPVDLRDWLRVRVPQVPESPPGEGFSFRAYPGGCGGNESIILVAPLCFLACVFC